MKKLILLLIFITSTPLLPAEFRAGESVTIDNESDHDIYAAGNVVQNSAAILGDFIAAGNTVMINGSVGSDLNLAAGNAVINSPIKDDARLVGGNIQINHSIGGDGILLGGTIHFAKEAHIAGDLIAAGGTISLNNNIGGKAIVNGGSIILNGVVNGPLEASGDTLQLNGEVKGESLLRAYSDIKIGPEARFHGNVRYWTESGKADFGDSVVSGEAVYDPSLKLEEHDAEAGAAPGFFAFLMLGSGILSIGLLMYLFPVFLRESGVWLLGNPVMALGMGLLYYLVTPAIALLLMVLIIGIPLGFFIGSFYLFTILFALSFSSVVVAYSLREFLKKQWSGLLSFSVATGFFIFFALLGLIPIIGWLVLTLIALAGTGSLMMNILKRYRSNPVT